jgi:hypothetical protein
MSSRRSESSIPARMCLRDRPWVFSFRPGLSLPGPTGLKILVATTTSSRLNSLPSSRPVATSLAPAE